MDSTLRVLNAREGNQQPWLQNTARLRRSSIVYGPSMLPKMRRLHCGLVACLLLLLVLLHSSSSTALVENTQSEDGVEDRLLPGRFLISEPPSSEVPAEHSPTTEPSTSPSTSPTTTAPSKSPSTAPTWSPSSSMPSLSPSASPSSSMPSVSPSVSPTSTKLSQSPSKSPSTPQPSTSPSKSPSTPKPSQSPSASPSEAPSTSPSTSPTTSKPSQSPSKFPSEAPSTSPSTSPTTSRPSQSPSRSPSRSPSTSPSESPTTSHPSSSPSKSPSTSQPTYSPTTSLPTGAPTTSPSTSRPTSSPTTSKPTLSPTSSPTTSKPTLSPSSSPTTSKPTLSPSSSPTTSKPTQSPSSSPTTSKPTLSPTSSPTTSKPTLSPSSSPTTTKPTQSPSSSPTTSKPTLSPTSSPTTSKPTQSPSSTPTTSKPTLSPSSSPTTSKPTLSPTSSPTTSRPTLSPSRSPATSKPTLSPSQSPTTSRPSESPTTSQPTRSPTGTPRPNVLLFTLDDLKPLIGAYDSPFLPVNATRHMDRLVHDGISFMNAHAQMAICGPSRASMLTSMRPDMLRIYSISAPNLLNNAIRPTRTRKEILTLPKLFKLAGYRTYGIGKVFHENEFTLMQRADTWTVPMFSWVDKLTRAPVFSKPYEGTWIASPDVEDDFFADGQAARLAADLISDVLSPKNASSDDSPWFLAVGLWKPHLPWTAPRKYFDQCGSSSDFNGPYDTSVPRNMRAMDFAFVKGNGCGETRRYAGPAVLGSGRTSVAALQQASRAYHATSMYADAQIGIVLDALDASPARDDTIIVLAGDHGFHLGDKGLYCKHTNFEQATRVPLIFVPTKRSRHLYPADSRSYAPVELLDLIPTLVELTEVRNYLNLNNFAAFQGTSLVPIMRDPTNGFVKQAAVSQYFRKRGSKTVWGYTVRTTRYRYTLWGNRIQELYDYLNSNEERTSLHANAKLRTDLVKFAYRNKQFNLGNGKMPFDFSNRQQMLARPPARFP